MRHPCLLTPQATKKRTQVASSTRAAATPTPIAGSGAVGGAQQAGHGQRQGGAQPDEVHVQPLAVLRVCRLQQGGTPSRRVRAGGARGQALQGNQPAMPGSMLRACVRCCAASHAAARQVLHAVQRTRTRGRRVVRSWGVDTDTYPRAGRACTHVGARPSASSSLRSCKQTRCSTERGVLPPLRDPTAGWRSPPPPRCCATPAGPPPSTAARRPQLRRAEHTACVSPSAMPP
jgi:hypothetical protein